jgi:hypothetical protein
MILEPSVVPVPLAIIVGARTHELMSSLERMCGDDIGAECRTCAAGDHSGSTDSRAVSKGCVAMMLEPSVVPVLLASGNHSESTVLREVSKGCVAIILKDRRVMREFAALKQTALPLDEVINRT